MCREGRHLLPCETLGLDDQIRARDELEEPGASRGVVPVEGDAPLRRVQEAEQRAVAVGLDAARGPATHGIPAVGMLHLDDVRARVGEQLRRIGTRDVGRELDDAKTRERMAHGRRSGT